MSSYFESDELITPLIVTYLRIANKQRAPHPERYASSDTPNATMVEVQFVAASVVRRESIIR
jgi:hypothetical protein